MSRIRCKKKLPHGYDDMTSNECDACAVEEARRKALREVWEMWRSLNEADGAMASDTVVLFDRKLRKLADDGAK